MLKKLFGFDPAQNKLKTEIVAGITTFLTMAYILAVNPNIFSSLASQGMDTHAVFTATVLAAVVGTLIMAIYAKKPFGLAPGMGLNLTRNNSLIVQQQAIFLNYIAGEGRRKFVIPTVETDADGRQKVVDKISFKYIDQK